MPVRIAFRTGECKDNLVAGLVVPIESFVPTAANLIGAISAIEDGLCHRCAVIVVVFADVNLGIEIQSHQQGGCSCLCPRSLMVLIAAQSGFLGQQGDGIFQFALNEIVDLFGGNLRLNILA